MHVINTASGGTLDLDAPRAAQITLGDIAGGLSRICRFGAQASRFHSVAEHAVLVSDLLAQDGHPELRLLGLHHDSHEAYVCDIPAPLKRKLRAAGQTLYEQVCDAIDAAVFEALGLRSPSAEAKVIIKAADDRALMIEAADLLPDGGRGIAAVTGLVTERPGQLGPSLAPDAARDAFLARHAQLTGAAAAP